MKHLPSKFKEILFFCCILMVGCDQVDWKFTVVNQSTNTISYYLTPDSTGSLAKGFYASTYYNTPDGKVPKEFEYIKGSESGKIITMGKWGTNSPEFKNGKTYIYTIDSVNIGMDSSILEKEHLIRKHQVTLDYMMTHSWTIDVN